MSLAYEKVLATYWAWYSEYHREIEPKDPTRRLDERVKDFVEAVRKWKELERGDGTET